MIAAHTFQCIYCHLMAKPAQCMANHARVDPKQPQSQPQSRPLSQSQPSCSTRRGPRGAKRRGQLEQLMLSNFVGNLCHIGDCRLSRNEAITPCVTLAATKRRLQAPSPHWAGLGLHCLGSCWLAGSALH